MSEYAKITAGEIQMVKEIRDGIERETLQRPIAPGSFAYMFLFGDGDKPGIVSRGQKFGLSPKQRSKLSEIYNEAVLGKGRRDNSPGNETQAARRQDFIQGPIKAIANSHGFTLRAPMGPLPVQLDARDVDAVATYLAQAWPHIEAMFTGHDSAVRPHLDEPKEKDTPDESLANLEQPSVELDNELPF